MEKTNRKLPAGTGDEILQYTTLFICPCNQMYINVNESSTLPT